MSDDPNGFRVEDPGVEKGGELRALDKACEFSACQGHHVAHLKDIDSLFGGSSDELIEDIDSHRHRAGEGINELKYFLEVFAPTGQLLQSGQGLGGGDLSSDPQDLASAGIDVDVVGSGCPDVIVGDIGDGADHRRGLVEQIRESPQGGFQPIQASLNSCQGFFGGIGRLW